MFFVDEEFADQRGKWAFFQIHSVCFPLCRIFVAQKQNEMKNMTLQCSIIFGCLALGEMVVHFTGIKMPSSIVGMLLLTALLQWGVVKLDWVKGISEFLSANLAFFFIPPGVGLMLHFGLIKAQFIPIIVATVLSTVLVLVVTGWVHQIARRRNGFHEK